MPIPDFFIIGAPKCGTTSLADWLSQHPGIFMCRPKEPHYYSPELVAYPAARSKVEYERLFASANPHQLIGEASTGYLRSKHAVAQILDDNADAKFIVCLRNPMQMARSVHSQLLKSGRATNKDFEKSWATQEVVRGAEVRETIMTICELGKQVKHLLAVAPRSQVMFMLLEDLQFAPSDSYVRTLEFIGAPYHESVEFRPLNKRAHPRSTIVAQAASLAWRLKRKMGISRSLGAGALIAAYNNRTSEPTQTVISAQTQKSLTDAFSDDIWLLERLIGRDLSAWRK